MFKMFYFLLMSSQKYETPEQLIRKIKRLSKEVQKKITFTHEGETFSFYTDTENIEVKVNGEKSHIPLQKFREKYKASGLTDLLRAMNEHYSVIQAI